MIGAGVGGLATAVRLAAAGHAVTVLEAGDAPGGKCGRIERDGFAWDSGPSLLTMPWVFEALFAETGAPLGEELELLPVEPVTRYRFADGSGFDLSADLGRSCAALDAWRPGAGDEWAAFMRTCERMWRASEGVLAGPAPWPPRRPRPGDPRPSPLDLARVQPWRTLARARPRAHARRAAADGDRALRHLRGRRPAARAGRPRRGRVRGARVGRLVSTRRPVRPGGGARPAARGARRRAAAGRARRADRRGGRARGGGGARRRRPRRGRRGRRRRRRGGRPPAAAGPAARGARAQRLRPRADARPARPHARASPITP